MAETTPTVYFPESSINYVWSPIRGKTFSTEILALRNGQEQRREIFVDGPYEYWQATSKPLSDTQRSAIIDFWEGRKGQLLNFYFFRPEPHTFTDWYALDIVAQNPFIIPVKESTITGVKVDDVSQTFTVQSAQGSGGEDQITLTGTPDTTGVVKLTGSGRKRFIARFASDDVTESFYQAAELLSVVSITVKEVR